MLINGHRKLPNSVK